MNECIENIDENKIVYKDTLNGHKNVCGSCECSSCTICIVLFSVFFNHKYWYWYYFYSFLLVLKTLLLILILALEQRFIECNSIECNLSVEWKSIEHISGKY